MAFLQTRNGFDAGRVYELDAGEHLIGRHPECAVFIELRSVSRNHAKIIVRDDSALLVDLGSRNGTVVNRKRVDGEQELNDGDEVRVCDIVFGYYQNRPNDLPFVSTSSTTVSPSQPTRTPELTEISSSDPRSDFRPTISTENLQIRAGLLRQLREFFYDRAFLEVDTPLLSCDTVIDRYIEPIPVILGRRRRWLQTSPEFAMKRMLAGGQKAIYQVTKAFREGERGRLHNPEFSIVEWYRVGESMEDAMGTLSDLCQVLLKTPSAEAVSYQDAFLEHLDFDPIHGKDTEFIQVIASLDIAAPEHWRTMDRDGWLNLLLSEVIQPRLGIERPTILHGFPASQAALAALNPDNPKIAQRFELFYQGIELANGYHELRDAGQLRERNVLVNALRRKDGASELPEDSLLLGAMDHGLPECSGVAMGFDRVVMLACGAEKIDDVLTFPIERA